LVEEIAVLNARNSYSSRGAQEGVDVLAKIKDAVTREGEVVGAEFARVIERLDVANERLEKTLADLRGAVVDTSLQNTENTEVRDDTEHDDEDTSPTAEKTLYTFIDPSKHSHLQSSLRQDIDAYYSSRADLDHTLTTFSESLGTISSLLTQDTSTTLPDKSPLYNDPPLPIPDLFSGMEEHAAAMASLLGSLVRHYDLSVTALKHTEGGGEAAKRALQQASIEQNVAAGQAMEESLSLKTVPEPISEEERSEMLAVLENDAEEVEDVVSELRDRNMEQEALFSSLSEHARTAKHCDARLRETLTMLHEMRSLHLPTHLEALHSFRQSWQRIREAILDKTDSMHGLAASNERFLAAYAQLLREVERRDGVQAQMRKVAEKANRELRRLWERDREERASFLEEFGAFLPRGICTAAEEVGVGVWEVREV
jgi:autophagy-related protein 17